MLTALAAGEASLSIEEPSRDARPDNDAATSVAQVCVPMLFPFL